MNQKKKKIDIANIACFLLLFTLVLAICYCLLVNASAADEEYPFLANGQTYSNLSDAFNASTDGTVYVIHDGVLSTPVNIGSGQTLIVNNGVTLYNQNTTTNDLSFNSGSTLTMYGNIVTMSGIRVFGGTLNLYGDITAPISAALIVRMPSTIYCSGAIISAQNDCIHVYENAVGSTIVVNGGTFYSQTRENPLNPLDAVTFEGDNEVTIQNGIIIATSYESVIGSVTRLVNSSVNWIGIFMGAVITNALLTLICVVAFVGLGIGLIKRIKR